MLIFLLIPPHHYLPLALERGPLLIPELGRKLLFVVVGGDLAYNGGEEG
jgi:hypothetical protein